MKSSNLKKQYHKFCEVACLDPVRHNYKNQIYYKTDKDNFYLFYKGLRKYKLICKIPRNNDILFSIGINTRTMEYNISFKNFKTYTFYIISERPLNLFLNMVVNVYELYKPRLHQLPNFHIDSPINSAYRENYNKQVVAMSHIKQILDNKLGASLSLLRYRGQNKDTINYIKNYMI